MTPSLSFITHGSFEQRDTVIAGASVSGTELTLLSLAPSEVIFGAAQGHMWTQVGLVLALTLVPNLLLLFQLRRAFRTFQVSEEDARRDERLRSLGEAVNLIAHEVKNSLNALGLGLDMILNSSRTGSTPTVSTATGLRREIERLSEFTSELLTFSRGITPRPVGIELSKFVQEVSELGTETAKELGVELRVGTAGPVRVKADPTLIHIVITNLVNNALEAVASSDAVPPTVRVGVSRRQGLAEVLVSDNGPGVADAIRARLFEPFVTGKPNGVGIGLALSRRIARAHGGDLELQPNVPGASFRLTLPVVEDS
jgi:two-component system C4-dicarboxylate transport sensor histidine kinase DctB